MSWELKFQVSAIEVKAWSATKMDVVATIEDEGNLREQLKDIYDEAMEEEYERGKEEGQEECDCEECDEADIESFDIEEIIEYLESTFLSKSDREKIKEFCQKFLKENP